MITINNSYSLEHRGMGLFETFTDWSHPEIAVETFELIYCIAGNLHIFEGEKRYTVQPNEMLLLEPNTVHGGFEITRGHTGFYWLHFKTNDINSWSIPKLSGSIPDAKKRFREIMHLYQTNKALSEIALAKFLLEIGENNTSKNKIVYEIKEYIRINFALSLTVSEVAEKFGYSPDYISKLFKKEFGKTIKSEIILQRLNAMETLLLNTNNSIKQIAKETGFESENDFVKFFKYNRHTTPTSFRNKFYKLHMNNH